MVKRRNNNRRRRRTPRRSRRVTMAPPRQDIQSNLTRTKLLLSIAVSSALSVFKYPIAVNTLVAGSALGYKTAFAEIKILSLRVYFISNRSMSDSGLVALLVCDSNENINFGSFTDLSIMPGSVVRKCWQSVGSMWYPTEPEDREYQSVTGTHAIADCVVMYNQSGAKVEGQLIIEARVLFRGRVGSTAVLSIMQDCIAEAEYEPISPSME